MIKLSIEERTRFIAFCKQEAANYDALSNQVESNYGIKRPLRVKAMGYTIVAEHLDSIEEQIIHSNHEDRS